MKFIIKHELEGRIRFRLMQQRMSCQQADRLSYYLQSIDGVISVRVHERTAAAIVYYSGDREKLLEAVSVFRYENVQVPEGILEHSGRQLSRKYQEKLMRKVICRMGSKILIPYPVRAAVIGMRACGYIAKGMRSLGRKRLGVEVLDAAAIGVSILRRDFRTAGSVMFLLGIGEILEEWTRKNL